MGSRLRRRPGKRAQDTWELTVDLPRDPTTGRQRRKVRAFHGTRAEARRALARMEEQVSGGTYVEPSRETLASFLERWLRDYVEPNTAPRTGQYYAQVIRQHVIPRLGAIPLQQLRAVHLVEAQRSWLDEGRRSVGDRRRGLHPNTVANFRRITRLALGHAVKWQLIATNPSLGWEPPRTERREQAWLNLEQAQALAAALEPTPAGVATLVLLGTGLRMGEVLGLRWRDVDLAGLVIALQQQLQRLGGTGYILRAVKSHRSRRAVAIDPHLAAVLVAHRERQAAMRASAPVWHMSDLVFTNEIGAHLLPDQVRGELLRALARAGLPRIRPHDLRHTHASLLARLGVPMKVVQERLGHASFSITADTYSHVSPDLQRQAATSLGAALLGPECSNFAANRPPDRPGGAPRRLDKTDAVSS